MFPFNCVVIHKINIRFWEFERITSLWYYVSFFFFQDKLMDTPPYNFFFHHTFEIYWFYYLYVGIWKIQTWCINRFILHIVNFLIGMYLPKTKIGFHLYSGIFFELWNFILFCMFTLHICSSIMNLVRRYWQRLSDRINIHVIIILR